jgi:serine/threonine protein kinase
MHRDIKPSNVLLGHDGSIKVRRRCVVGRCGSRTSLIWMWSAARRITTPPSPLTTPSSATLALPT